MPFPCQSHRNVALYRNTALNPYDSCNMSEERVYEIPEIAQKKGSIANRSLGSWNSIALAIAVFSGLLSINGL